MVEAEHQPLRGGQPDRGYEQNGTYGRHAVENTAAGFSIEDDGS